MLDDDHEKIFELGNESRSRAGIDFFGCDINGRGFYGNVWNYSVFTLVGQS